MKKARVLRSGGLGKASSDLGQDEWTLRLEKNLFDVRWLLKERGI